MNLSKYDQPKADVPIRITLLNMEFLFDNFTFEYVMHYSYQKLCMDRPFHHYQVQDLLTKKSCIVTIAVAVATATLQLFLKFKEFYLLFG